MQAKLKEQREVVAAMQRLQRLQLVSSFDAAVPESRPTPAQQEIFDDIGVVQFRAVIAGNQSGKSSVAAREIAWIVTDTHPTWIRPKEWGDEPLLILIAGQDRKQMEIELWTKKLKPFLDMSEWREARVGGVLNFVEHRKAQHKIVFLSHNDSSDKNRQHMQGYVAHYVWLDEMPRDIKILEELQQRVASRRGYFIVTFTPKIRNEAIRKVVDALEFPIGKRYRLTKLDNPLYAERKHEEIKKLEGYSDSYRNTVLYGDWFVGDSAVYQFDYASSVVEEILGYGASWRHVVSVDPALKSKCGFTLWAEDPTDGTWYLVNDAYIENKLNVDDLLAEVNLRIRHLNIVRRISDPHESWFIGQAAKHKQAYMYPYDKSNRKGELIKNLQLAISMGKIKIASWCETFVDEIQSCQFSETSDRIINSSKYHTLDASQYFVDLMPPYDESQRVLPWYLELRKKNAERKDREQAVKKIDKSSGGLRVVRNVYGWGRKKWKSAN